MINKRITIGFLGNFMYDTRTFNLRAVLLENGMDVRFVGFDWLTENYQTVKTETVYIRKLYKSRISVLFYAQYAFILIFNLLKIRSDIYWAADFYSLPLCGIAARLTGGKLYYDAREIYTGVRGIAARPWLKSLVFYLEKIIIAGTQAVFVTGPMDADILRALYRIPHIYLLRNLPRYQKGGKVVDYSNFFQSRADGKIMLYQGTLVHGRGIPFYFDIIKTHNRFRLVLLGGGEHEDEFKALSVKLKIEDRVFFAGKITQDQLFAYSAGADIGFALIDNISQNNELALPNKLFEYIMAGIPVIVSNLPQMADIVYQYQIGAIVDENDLQGISKILDEWDNSPKKFLMLKKNCLKASRVLNWETEFESVKHLFE